MIRPSLAYMALFFIPAYGMQQFSPHNPAEFLSQTSDQQALESLGIRITPEYDKTVIAKQIVPSMQQLIDNTGQQVTAVERVVLMLKMLNQLLPGKKLSVET